MADVGASDRHEYHLKNYELKYGKSGDLAYLIYPTKELGL